MSLNQTTIQGKDLPEFIPINKFNAYFPYPRVSTLRYYRFFNTNNFNELVVRKIGNRIYIKTSAYLEWIEDTNKVTA